MNDAADSPIAIVLTATITPQLGVEGVQRSDSKIRLEDYLNSLRFYLSLPNSIVDRIVFIENSGFELEKIAEKIRRLSSGKQVEFLSCPAPKVGRPSKEFGEFRLLEDGIAESKLLQEDDIFLKVTGRLMFSNLRQFLRHVDTEYDLMCDLHNVPLVGHGFQAAKYMDLRTFFCRVSTYKALFYGLSAPDRPSITATLLYSVVMDNSTRFRIVPRYKREAILSGVGARHNKDYNSGLPWFKQTVRGITRIIAPWIWL